MHTYFQQIIYRISGSYWFIPAIMVALSIVLAQIAIYLDQVYGSDWLKGVWFTSLNQPDGARAILATVAGSMITVAGVTFSLTILAVSHTSSQFGPRLLVNFMHDRGNQITLGTFVSTFMYCLMVLRVVRGEDVVADDGLSVGVFVPQLALIIALLLTLGSVAVLIYFIHHIPESIHITNVLRRVSIQLSAKLDELYPTEIGLSAIQDSTATDIAFSAMYRVCSARDGYLQGIESTEIMELANDKNAIIKLLQRPGQFIRLNEEIAEIDAPSGWSNEDSQRLRKCFTLGSGRTPTQDILFIINELVEVAIRALSPGVNDPFTAMQCIDWLSAALVRLGSREIPSRFRRNDDGILRTITPNVDYSEFVQSAIGQLIPYAREDPNASKYLLDTLRRTIDVTNNESLNSELRVAVAQIRKAETS